MLDFCSDGSEQSLEECEICGSDVIILGARRTDQVFVDTLVGGRIEIFCR